MRRRLYVALALGLAVAVVVVVPASGGTDGLLGRALRTAKVAKRKADQAQTKANRAYRLAKRQARRRKQGPPGAMGAQGVQGPPGQTGPAGTPPAIQFAEQATAVNTESDDYIDLGGPSVPVTVPASGLIEVYAQVTFSDDEGAIALYDGDSFLAGQNETCGEPPGGILDVDASIGGGTLTAGTGDALNYLGFCGSPGAASPLLFQLSPGDHTIGLRYLECGCGSAAGATFANRKLWIAPRP